LENAIRDGAAALPAGMVPRLLLISDGNENLGSVARAIWQARQLGLPIDTVALAGRPKPGLRLDSVTAPGQVFSGERFPIDVAVEAPGAAHARVELTAEGKTIGAREGELGDGGSGLGLGSADRPLGGRPRVARWGGGGWENTVTARTARGLVDCPRPAASEEHPSLSLHSNQFEVE